MQAQTTLECHRPTGAWVLPAWRCPRTPRSCGARGHEQCASPGGVPASPQLSQSLRQAALAILCPLWPSWVTGCSERKKPAPHPEAAAPLGLRARTERRGPCLACLAPPVLHHGAFPVPPSLPEPCPLQGSSPLGHSGSLTAAPPCQRVARRRCPVTEGEVAEGLEPHEVREGPRPPERRPAFPLGLSWAPLL